MGYNFIDFTYQMGSLHLAGLVKVHLLCIERQPKKTVLVVGFPVDVHVPCWLIETVQLDLHIH